MHSPIITAANLKKIGFKEYDLNGNISYERGGLKIAFGEVNGLDCIAANTDIPLLNILKEIEDKIRNHMS
jgi:hypothetical protein